MEADRSFDFMLKRDDDKDLLVEINGEWVHSQPQVIAKDSSKATYVHNYLNDKYELKTIWDKDFFAVNKVEDLISSWFNSKEIEVNNFSFSNIKIKMVKAHESNLLFSKYHYIANGGRAGVNIGAFLNNKLIACIRYCSPSRKESSDRLGLGSKELLELTRLVIHPRYQKKNFASWLISRSIKIIKDMKPKAKCLISFADSTFGHVGTVYKASNWIYDDKTPKSYYYRSNNGWIMHKKTLYNKAINMSMTESDYANKHNYVRLWSKEKHRYLYWL